MAKKVTTTIDPQRSHTMRAVKSKNTTPELIVRRLVHSLGYRYRLHRKDLVFPSRKKVIFVHGCFWHGHDCKRGDRIPKTNRDYWTKKIKRNVEWDEAAQTALADKGWSTLVLWECDLNRHFTLGRCLQRLNPSPPPSANLSSVMVWLTA